MVMRDSTTSTGIAARLELVQIIHDGRFALQCTPRATGRREGDPAGTETPRDQGPMRPATDGDVNARRARR